MGYTYAIGDLHGMSELLQDMLSHLGPGREDTLVFLGDYVDRGPDTLGVVTGIVEAERQCQVIALRGNHDADWVACWDWEGQRFTAFPQFLPGAAALWRQYSEQHPPQQVPPAIGQFLVRTQVTYEDSHCWYSHAGAQPHRPFPQSLPEWYIDGDECYRDTQWDWGKPVVCGHYEVDAPVVTPTKVLLDTAAYRTGVLTAYCAENGKIHQVRRAR